MMNINCILHPTDLSTSQESALQVASALAHDYGARLIVLHVARLRALTSSRVGSRPASYSRRDRIYVQLCRIYPSYPNISVEYRLEVGSAATEILNVALETHADLIVMGGDDRNGFKRLLRRCVAEQVAHKASCPVLIASTHQAEPHFSLDIEANEARPVM